MAPESVPRSRELKREAALIAGLIGNRPGAWREFHERYDPIIYHCIARVTRRFASVVSPDEVREVHASFYVALLSNDKRKLRVFDAERGTRLSSWIGFLAMNSAYDYLRVLRREPPTEDLEAAAHVVFDAPDPFERASVRERAAMAWAELERFPAKDQAFASLYFVDQMDPAQIARELNITVNTVHSKKYKIQMRLRDRLSSPPLRAVASQRHACSPAMAGQLDGRPGRAR